MAIMPTEDDQYNEYFYALAKFRLRIFPQVEPGLVKDPPSA
jgi:hypothetical protein